MARSLSLLGSWAARETGIWGTWHAACILRVNKIDTKSLCHADRLKAPLCAVSRF